MMEMSPIKQTLIIGAAFLGFVFIVAATFPAKAQGVNRLCFSGSLTDANCVPATTVTPYPVTAQISGGSSTISGTITSAQGTSPWVVSGPLTDTQLRASDVAVTASITPSAASGIGMVPSATSTITGSRVLKASAGNLYGFQVTSSTTAGYVLLFDSASTPADGTVTPIKCDKLAANSTLTSNYRPGPPIRFSNGLIAVYSTTGCFSKTTENSAFISGEAQ